MSNFTIKFHIKTPFKWQSNYINKKLKITKMIYNDLRNKELKKLANLLNDSEYKTLKAKKYKDWTSLDKAIYKAKIKEYGFTRFDFINDSKPIYKFYKDSYSSQMTQAVAKRLYTAFEKYFYGTGEEIKEMILCSSMEGTSNTNGIIVNLGNKKVKIGKYEFDIEINENDPYVKEAIKNKVAYVRIIKMIGKTKDRFYAQVVFQGNPPRKTRVRGIGNVGVDLGTSTYAVVSDNLVTIDELAKDINPMVKELKRLERKLERSRRATNPNNYETDGTIKKGKCKWFKSKHYKVLNRRKRYLDNKIARKRKESHEILVNRILAQGDKIIFEKMEYKKLQQRKKETTISNDGKYEKKKRFGKSLNRHAPSEFKEILIRKAKLLDIEIIEIDPGKIKASQYNHITDTYIKHNLNERKIEVGCHIVQRDLYSAFLLKNIDNNEINKNKCKDTFNRFLDLHNIEIERLQKQKNISCIGY